MFLIRRYQCVCGGLVLTLSPGAYNKTQTQVPVLFYPWCRSSAHQSTAANSHLRRWSWGRPRPLLTPPSRRSWPICWRSAGRPSASRRPMRSALRCEAPPTCRTCPTRPSSCSPTIWRSRRRKCLRRAAGRRWYPMMHLLTCVSSGWFTPHWFADDQHCFCSPCECVTLCLILMFKL